MIDCPRKQHGLPATPGAGHGVEAPGHPRSSLHSAQHRAASPPPRAGTGFGHRQSRERSPCATKAWLGAHGCDCTASPRRGGSPGRDREPAEPARSRQRCRGRGEQQHPSHIARHRRGCSAGAAPVSPGGSAKEQEVQEPQRPHLSSCPIAAEEGDSSGDGSRRIAEPLLDKQLPPIYLCPYGAAEQVCR